MQLGSSSREDARELWIMCKRDLLFFVNAFTFTYDPRVRPAALPFITYPFQDDGLLEIDSAIEHQYDLIVEKSRDMGFSWATVLVFYWRWAFHDWQSFLFGSRKAEFVEKKGDPKTLFWKFDFLQQHLPLWLKPQWDKLVMGRHNLENGATVDGEATVEDFARGDRRTAIELDENAAMPNGHEINKATADATGCRIKISTPKGMSNQFAVDRHSGKYKVLTAHWHLHPKKARGLYRVENDGAITIIDKDYWTDERKAGYTFIHVQPRNPKYKFRSPWYDKECDRRDTVEIAQELDIDYHGSGSQYFDPIELDDHDRIYSRNPVHRGELEFEQVLCKPTGWHEAEEGRFKVWLKLDDKGRPPRNTTYVVACDVSQGQGASNSTIAVADRKTREKVAAFAWPRLTPERFADLAVSVCRWFCGTEDGAFLIWEGNGPGGPFGSRVVELGYTNIFLRRNERSLSKKQTLDPGWWSTPENKQGLLAHYRRALKTGGYVNRDKEAIAECYDYVFLETGKIAHSQSTLVSDPSGAGDSHGDRVIADALAAKIVVGPIEKPEEQPDEFQPGSFGWRREEARKKLEYAEAW